MNARDGLAYPKSEKLGLGISDYTVTGYVVLASTDLISTFFSGLPTGLVWSVGTSAMPNEDLLKITEGYFTISLSSVDGLTLILDSVTEGILLFSPNESKAC